MNRRSFRCKVPAVGLDLRSPKNTKEDTKEEACHISWRVLKVPRTKTSPIFTKPYGSRRASISVPGHMEKSIFIFHGMIRLRYPPLEEMELIFRYALLFNNVDSRGALFCGYIRFSEKIPASRFILKVF